MGGPAAGRVRRSRPPIGGRLLGASITQLSVPNGQQALVSLRQVSLQLGRLLTVRRPPGGPMQAEPGARRGAGSTLAPIRFASHREDAAGGSIKQVAAGPLFTRECRRRRRANSHYCRHCLSGSGRREAHFASCRPQIARGQLDEGAPRARPDNWIVPAAEIGGFRLNAGRPAGRLRHRGPAGGPLGGLPGRRRPRGCSLGPTT